jgi:anti-repressor protein
MRNQLTTFNFEGANVQVIKDENNEPWFLAKDICAILGYANVSQTINDHCKEAGVSKRYISSESGAKQTIFINEGNFYRLVVKSNKPEAERFESWVCDEVLVSIRKTGSYSVQPIDPMELFSDPAAMLQLATDYAKRLIEKDEVIAEQAPKVAALARLSESEGSLNVTESAKALGIQPSKLFLWLQTNGWIYRRAGNKNWLGYQGKVQRGYLTHKVRPILLQDGTERIEEQVRIMPKGLTKLAKVFSVGEATGGTANA